ncbi:MAG: DNA-protecting protein DprA [Cytophagales bacterium]|nr:MAG: DNA-protecting protein DprA [Cytophagales bacterium]TAF61482.1 MAG: DNA-protecting protein DprA [Cytophagales bacterium]
MSTDERLHTLALSFVPGIGHKIAKYLIASCESAVKIWQKTPAQIQKIPDIGPKLSKGLIENREKSLLRAEEELRKASDMGVKLLLYTDEDFPNRLKILPDSPLLLYVRGEANLNMPKSLGIVGTRKASAYGKSITEQIVANLTHFKPTVVSGLAYGIDIQAHKSCIAHQVPTVAVLACGVDVIYPLVHTSYVEAFLAQGGALVSERALGTPPDSALFPSRNRIIAGLSDALVVVEAAEKGGALITADIAFSYDREVFAVPGNLGSNTSVGCNKLIQQQKATIYTSNKDIEEALKWDMSDYKLVPKKLQGALKSENLNLEGAEKLIFDLLSHKGKLQIDEIAIYTQLPISTVGAKLFELELKNLVKTLPWKHYELA